MPRRGERRYRAKKRIVMLEVFCKAVTETVNDLLGDDEILDRRIGRVQDQSHMTKDLVLVAGCDTTELRVRFHLLELPKDADGVDFLQERELYLLNLGAAGGGQRLRCSRHGSGDVGIGRTKELGGH